MNNSTKTQSSGRKVELIDPFQGAIAALEYFGVQHDGRRFTCPVCGTNPDKKKTVIRSDGGITCHKCGTDVSTGNMFGTVKRLAELTGRGELEKREMVSILRGFDPDGQRGRFVTKVVEPPEPEPETVVDSEVLTALYEAADQEAGVAYWHRFHIAPQVARAFGAARLTEPWGVTWNNLVSNFGLERLIDAGLAKKLEDGSVWTVPGGRITEKSAKFAPDYPVLQIYRLADGTPVGMEVRGNEYIEGRIREHDAYKVAYEKWEAGGGQGNEPTKVRWTPKTRNLVGNAKGSRVGFGLDVVSRFAPTRVVWIVEGYKDALAAGSLGRPAIGIAGAKAGISDEAIEVLRGRKVAVAFDSDDAGAEGAAKLGDRLREAGVELVGGPRWADGMDVADTLARVHAKGGAVCEGNCGKRKS